MPLNFIFVALGGAAGAMGRYAVSLLPVRTEFPALTFVTNILGAFLIGFISGMTESRKKVNPHEVLFWKTGVCGGFTTFSTFSLESYTLLHNKKFIMGSAYMLLSVICCLAGVLLGRKLAMTIS